MKRAEGIQRGRSELRGRFSLLLLFWLEAGKIPKRRKRSSCSNGNSLEKPKEFLREDLAPEEEICPKDAAQGKDEA